MFNFPNVEDVYRVFLKSDAELSRLRSECESKLRDFNDLRQLSESAIGELSFEDLFLPYDFHESIENYKALSINNIDEVLEKYVILKYIVAESPHTYLENGISYFDYTIYGDLVRSKYKTSSQLLARIQELDKQYNKIFNDFHNAEITKLLNFPKDKNKSSKFNRFFK